MTQHIYHVHAVECQPQWPANDNEPIQHVPYLGLACLAASGGLVVWLVLKLVEWL